MARRFRKAAQFSALESASAGTNGDPDLGVEALVVRARTSSRRGDARKAFLLLERACCLASEDARVWTLFAVQCQRMGKIDDAARAYRQAIWLRERAKDERRAAVLQRLLSELRRKLPAA
jgi:Flp pilus assembly protein TadD